MATLDGTGQAHPGSQDGVCQPRITTRGWSLNELVESSPNFRRVPRTHYSAPSLKASMSEHEIDGTPLIIYGWNRHPRWLKTFDINWLKTNGDQYPVVRNVHNWSDIKIPLSDFIDRIRASPVYASAEEQERLYGKDSECPAQWTEWLMDGGVIPDDVLFDGPNDFLKFLPRMAKVQTLMCYVGIGDTFTPFHKDLCASSGQNLMCYSENNGSSFWFMTKASDAPKVVSYFRQLGQEVDLETHVVTLDELRSAPFEVYIAEQCVGDLVLVPPRSCHQVVNNGGITIKTSWSRMSLDGLQIAIYYELPIYHRVCRPEIYKVKSNIYHAMCHHTTVMDQTEPGAELVTLAHELKKLLDLFDDILAQEYTAQHKSLPNVSQSGAAHYDNIHCDFCGADIFQSFFECDKCAFQSDGDSAFLPLGDGLVVCPSCYVEGRTCRCGEMQPVQHRVMDDLLQSRDSAARAIQRFECQNNIKYGYLSEHPERLLEQGAGIFESACKLHQRQQVGFKMRSCRARSVDPPHQAPAMAVITCKPCHSSRCFFHILEICRIHSVEAILRSEHDGGDIGWHHFHMSSKEAFTSAQNSIDEDEQVGRRPNILRRLAHLARTLVTCKPLNGLTKPGWYDHYIQVSTIPIVPSTVKAVPDFPDDASSDGPASNETCFPGAISMEGIDADVAAPAENAGDGIDPVLNHPFLQSTSSCTEPHGSPATLSDLTELPSDHDSPIIFQSTLDPSPPPNTTSLIINTSQPNHQGPTDGEDRQRVFMAFVEVPQPDWYKRMREKGKAVPRLPSRCFETPESDDMPIKRLAQRYIHNQSAGPSHCKSDSFSRGAHGPISLNPAAPIPMVRGSTMRGQAVQTGQNSSLRKRKHPQGAPPRSSQPAKRPRSDKSFLRPPESNGLAAALNQTFECNSGSKKYKSVGVQKRLNFTKTKNIIHTTGTSDGPDPTVVLGEVEAQRSQLSRYENENRALKERLESMTLLINTWCSPVHAEYPPSSSFPSCPPICPDHFPVSVHPDDSLATSQPLDGLSAKPLSRRRTPTEPRSHRRPRFNHCLPEGGGYKRNKYKHRLPNKNSYSRTPRSYKGGKGRSRTKWKPSLELRLMDHELPAIMTSPSPTRSNDQSQSSSATIQVQQDDSEESSMSCRSLLCNEQLVVSSPPPKHHNPRVSRFRDAEGHITSEDEISLGDEDEYLPMFF